MVSLSLSLFFGYDGSLMIRVVETLFRFNCFNMFVFSFLSLMRGLGEERRD